VLIWTGSLNPKSRNPYIERAVNELVYSLIRLNIKICQSKKTPSKMFYCNSFAPSPNPEIPTQQSAFALCFTEI
jgi:hypothetical protein